MMNQCIKEKCKNKKHEDNELCRKHYRELLVVTAENENKKMCRNFIRGCVNTLVVDGKATTCEQCLAKRREKPDDFKKCFQCKNRCLDDKEYCEKHKSLHYKLEIEKDGKKLCRQYERGCRNILPENYMMLTCEQCLEKNKNPNKILCKYENCKHKKSNENDYCGKHQRQHFKNETEKENKKVCNNYLRGCDNKLNKDYKFTRCEECLLKEREKDKIRKENKSDNITNIDEIKIYCEKNNLTNKNNEEINFCNTCVKGYIKSDYISNNVERVRCSKCRDANKIQDAKRDIEHVRELGRKNGQKEERKKVKKEWKNNNYEKCVGYWIKARGNKMSEENTDYWTKRNENAKKWRADNPEKVKEIKKQKKINLDYKITTYKNCALNKGLEFTLTDDETVELIKNKCYYCNEFGEYGITGIDRIENSKGYIKENVVSCCEMCNFMKGSLNDYVFIKKIEHILTYQKLKEGELNYELFGDHSTESFSYYKKRAIKKTLEFTLTKDDYNRIIKEKCFICGKESDKNNKNGIDRYYNNIGYMVNNINSCCCECNLQKKDYEFNDFIAKIILIYNNTKNYEFKNTKIENTCLILKNENKCNKQEIKEKYKNKLANQRENTINNNTNDNIIKKRIENLVEKRFSLLFIKLEPTAIANRFL